MRPRGWRARPDRELPRPRGGARGGLGSGSPRGDTWAETVRGSCPGAPSSGPGLGGPASPSPEARDPGGRALRISEEKEVVSGKEGRCVRSILPLRRLGREEERLGVRLGALSVLLLQLLKFTGMGTGLQRPRVSAGEVSLENSPGVHVCSWLVAARVLVSG